MSVTLSTAPGAGPSPTPSTPELLCPSAEEGGSSTSTAPNRTLPAALRFSRSLLQKQWSFSVIPELPFTAA